MQIENLLFDIAEALRYPVMILILLALVAALVEAGALMAELFKRRGRGIERLDFAIAHIRTYLATGDNQSALNTVHALGYNDRMSDAYDALILQRGLPVCGEAGDASPASVTASASPGEANIRSPRATSNQTAFWFAGSA